MSTGELATSAAGALVVVLTLIDLFLTVFNYDGFTFAASRFQNLCWRAVLAGSSILPSRARRAARSLGSSLLVPATVGLWVGAEITGFALIYWAGLSTHGFDTTQHIPGGLSSAYYLSAGAQSSLTFGDLIAGNGLYRAALDTQTILGLATFTLALGYVVTTFGILGDLNGLHNAVRRHARHPRRPTSILARHYRGGEPTELSGLLQILSERLEGYDEGLRRYPVVFYFHTRRASRSIPQVFASLGELLADLRWGLPPGDAMASDPWLAALLEQYSATLGRLQRSFVGPERFVPPAPLPAPAFEVSYTSGTGDEAVADFRELQERTRKATGLAAPPDPDLGATYERYRDWLPFDRRRGEILDRVALNLGYEPAEIPAEP